MQQIEPYKQVVRLQETQIQALSDDYVKFFRIGEVNTTLCTIGILGFVTSDNYVIAATFRDMRKHLLSTYPSINIFALKGNLRTREALSDDENVFDIKTGVSVFIGRRAPNAAAPKVNWTELTVSRIFKFSFLTSHTIGNAPVSTVFPQAEYYIFEPRIAGSDEYHTFFRAPDVFGTGDYISDKTVRYGSGFKSQQDEFAITFDREQVIKNVEYLISPKTTEADLRSKFSMCGSDQWRFDRARERLRKVDWRNQIIRCLYRPFDIRYSVLNADVISNPRREIMEQYLRSNLGLCLGRQGQVIPGTWNIVFCTDKAQDQNLFYRGGNTNFPLWIGGEVAAREHANLAPAFTVRLAVLTNLRFDDGSDAPAQRALPGMEPLDPTQALLPLRRERGDLAHTFGARDVFDWIYAVLHSPTYRERYADFLKSDFARVPLPKDRSLFAELIPLGTRLVALHLLDAAVAQELGDPVVRFVNNGGEACIGKFGKEVRRDKAGRIYLNAKCWFATVPQTAWEHWIGGYRPAQKWLKDRAETGSKPGRNLADADILHYRRMIVALEETAKVMTEIDQVIDRHGGWPGAFKGVTD